MNKPQYWNLYAKKEHEHNDYLSKSNGGQINAHLEVIGAQHNFIAPNNYGYCGRLTDGSADYLAYMGNDNRVYVGHNNRGITLACEFPVQANGYKLFHEGFLPSTVSQTWWTMNDLDWVGEQTNWGSGDKFRSVKVNGGDPIGGMYQWGVALNFGADNATGQIYLPDNRNSHEMYFRSTWSPENTDMAWKRVWNNYNMNPYSLTVSTLDCTTDTKDLKTDTEILLSKIYELEKRIYDLEIALNNTSGQ